MKFEELIAEALRRFTTGDRSGCEELCIQAIRIQPDDPGTLNLLGQCLLEQKRPSEAGLHFIKAIQARPDLPSLRFNLALAYHAEGRISEAIASVREAIRLDPDVPALHSKLGQLLNMVGASHEAESVLRTAVEMDPSSVPAKLNLAQALTDLGDLAGAESLARGALKRQPVHAMAHRLIGRIRQIEGRLDEATTSFQQAVDLQPENAAPIHELIFSRKIADGDVRLVDRIRPLATSLSYSIDDRRLLSYALGKALDDLGEFEEAAAAYRQANELALLLMPPFDPDEERRKNDDRMQFLSRSDGSPSERPVFIVGMIRSGTTLVEQVLARHSEIAAGGENPFWLANEGACAENLPSCADGYASWMDRVSPSARLVTNKMPLNYQVLWLIHRAFHKAKFVHVRRDPRDTCLSVYLTPYRVSPAFGHREENIRFAYGEYLRLMHHWRSALPAGTMIEIDYEALVNEGETTIRRLVEFLGLNWEDGLLDSSGKAASASTPSVWQARQPIYRTSVGRWKRYDGLLSPWP